MNSPVSYMGNDPIRDQLQEIAVRARILSSLNSKKENEGEEWNADDEDIII